MSGSHSKEKWQQAVEMIARGLSRSTVAEAVEVSMRTLDRWLANPEFKAAVAEARQQNRVSLRQRWEALAEEHLAAASRVRMLVESRLAEIESEYQQGTTPNAAELVKLASALSMAIGEERDALSMEWLSSNRAVQHVQQLGFIVQRPDGATVEAEFAVEP